MTLLKQQSHPFTPSSSILTLCTSFYGLKTISLILRLNFYDLASRTSTRVKATLFSVFGPIQIVLYYLKSYLNPLQLRRGKDNANNRIGFDSELKQVDVANQFFVMSAYMSLDFYPHYYFPFFLLMLKRNFIKQIIKTILF